jgi:hypothetical protein
VENFYCCWRGRQQQHQICNADFHSEKTISAGQGAVNLYLLFAGCQYLIMNCIDAKRKQVETVKLL